jgi:hypothetical protein
MKTAANKMLVQWPGSVSSLRFGFISYICHVGQVATQLAFSLDQSVLAVSEDEELVLYSPQTLLKTREFEKGHSKTITSILFCEDNKHIITAGLDSKLIYWDYTGGIIQKSWVAPKPIIDAQIVENEKVALITEKEFIIYDFAVNKTLSSIASQTPLATLSVAADEKTIVTGTSLGIITMYDAYGNIIRNFKHQPGLLTALDICPLGDYVVSGYENGKIRLYDKQGTIVASFTDAKKWIRALEFTTDAKYFAVGDDWGNCLVYSTDKKIIAEKFKIDDVPILTLEFSPDGMYITVIASQREISSWDMKKLNIASVFKVKDQKDRTPPQIYVSSPPNIQDDKVRIYKDMVEIRGTLMDESGIRNLRVNGREVPIKDNNNFVFIQPLSMGDNQFAIEAKDVNDNISIKRFTVQRKNLTGEEYDVAKARNFLFVVGINDYEYWPKLNNAVKDANDIANSLLRQYNFEFDNVVLLKNEQATRSNIYKSLRSLIEQVTPQDNLLIYFSGHGYFDGLLNEGYWIPIDAKVNNSGDYLSNSDILKIIGNIDSQHTFLIADACFSGSLFSESKKGYAENVEKYKSRWGLASGRLEVVSDGAIGQNSPFATATITFLNENTKDKFAISELIQYVKMKVAETSDPNVEREN